MPYTFEVSDSNNKNKKLKVVIYKDVNKLKTIHVVDNRYEDYIQYYKSSGASFANTRKEAYLKRHHKEDNTYNILTRGYWAKQLLWTKPTLEESIKDTRATDFLLFINLDWNKPPI
jgi:hypothetical protein